MIKLHKRDTKATMTLESPMYVYATEMVGEYYKLFDIKGKRVLTILGSGDQIINACLFGAQKIIGFDINKRASFFTNLKLTALQVLDYESFILYFGSNFSDGSFSHDIYLTFSERLNKKTKLFFDQIYSEISGNKFLESKFFRQRSHITRSTNEVNPYLLNKEAYSMAKDNLKDTTIRMIVSDLQNVADQLRGETFDIINLSNIPNYFVGKTDNVTPFFSVLKELNHLLDNHGVIFFYKYDISRYGGEPPFVSTEKAKTLIKELGLFIVEEYQFQGMTPGEHDGVIVLKKIPNL